MRDIYISQIGEQVRIGPKFAALLKDITPKLQLSKRTKAYKEAAAAMERIETAIDVLSEAEWVAGGFLKETP